MRVGGHDLKDCPVEHDSVHPDDLPGYWSARRDEPGLTTREYAAHLAEAAA